MALRQVCLQKASQRRFQLKQQCLRIGARGVRKACCSERRCGHERRLARSWVSFFYHWILQACCQEKDEKIHFSPEMCEKKSNVHNFLQDHCNRGANSWETSALTSAHMVLCLESEKNTFKKRDELSKLTENSWTCCCLVTETPRWEAVRKECLVLQWWEAGCVRNDGLYLILVVGLSWIVCCPKTSAPSFPWPETFGLGDGYSTWGKK